MLLHDAGPSPSPTEQQTINWMGDLLGHFSPEVTVLPVESYQAGLVNDPAKGLEAIVYLGFWEGSTLPESFLTDCREARKPICWLGANIEQLGGGATPEPYGFHVGEVRPGSGATRIIYRSLSFRREATPFPAISITDSDRCHTVAAAESENGPLPYAVRAGDLLYFAEIPALGNMKGGAHIILCDQIHELLDNPHDSKLTALFFIAEVTPNTNSAQLADRIRRLQALGLPFAIEVQPFGPRNLALSSRRALVSVLRGAQRTGASIIGLLPSADKKRGQQVGHLTDDIDKALGELSKCGLYPLAWSLARDSFSEEKLSEASHLFSSVLSYSPTKELELQTAPLPFLIASDRHGQRVLPDNGLRLQEGRGEVEEILDSAQRQAIVTDSWIAVGIAPTAPTEAVALLANGLLDLSYEPTDLRYLSNWTKTDHLQVHSVEAPHHLDELAPESWDVLLIGPRSGQVEEVAAAEREESLVRPGAIVVAFPSGKRPQVVFSFEGDPQQVTQRGVNAIARAIVFFALSAIAILALIYLAQILQRRGT